MSKNKKKGTKKIQKTVQPVEVGKTGLQPLADRVLIKENTSTAEKKMASGIIIPITVDQDKGSKKGRVVAVGKGKIEDGKIVPMSVKVGDEVLFQWGDNIKVGDEEYYVVRESEILAIIK